MKASTQLQISSDESVLLSRFLGGEHWSLKVLSESTSCDTGGEYILNRLHVQMAINKVVSLTYRGVTYEKRL